MSKDLLICATDQEIFDILMSARQRLSEAVLFEMAKDRGIIFSSRETRFDMANAIALMGHGYHDVSLMLERREAGGRNEPVTSIELPPMTSDQAKQMAKSFRETAEGFDNIVQKPLSSDAIGLEVAYSEIDHSKTRLLQRRKREASVDIEIQPGKTIIRVPSSEKGLQIADALMAEAAKQLPAASVVPVRIEVSALVTAQARTEFFIRLMQNMESFSLVDVTRISATPWSDEKAAEADGDGDSNEGSVAEEVGEAEVALLSAVRQVALKGSVLLASPMYQTIRESGFALSAARWISQEAHTNDQYEFEASFENPAEGTGFRYKVRGVRRYDSGAVLKTIRPVPADQLPVLYGYIEASAIAAIEKLKAGLVAEEGDGNAAK